MVPPEHPFHLAFPVDDLVAARAFYAGTLGCAVGRTSSTWIDFSFFGHQITAHLVAGAKAVATNEVDGDDVPVRHFGLVLSWGEWEALGARLRAAGVDFLLAPHVRFAAQVGEQGTFFVRDPSGNALEFKAFRDPENLFRARPPGSPIER